MVKTEPQSENIFNITEAHRYRCQMHHYHSRLSRLYYRVYKDERDIPAFYLLFSDVAYVEGAVNWKGADFRIADADECIELMLEVGLIGEAILRFPNAYASITDHAKLYVADMPLTPVRLIAGSATLLTQLPADLV